MRARTFLRIMLDNLFVNNVLCRTIQALVNFCNEQSYYNSNELKFLKKMPLSKTEQKTYYQKKFIFNSNHKTGVDLR